MSDCTILSLCHLLETNPDELNRWFEWGKETMPDGSPKPPGIHKVIDYLMTVGIALTPIAREPVVLHRGRVIQDYDREEAEQRWEMYTSFYTGLLIGMRGDVGHMVYLDKGLVYDRDRKYDISECDDYQFTPHTFMVATWEA